MTVRVCRERSPQSTASQRLSASYVVCVRGCVCEGLQGGVGCEVRAVSLSVRPRVQCFHVLAVVRVAVVHVGVRRVF